MPFETDLNCLGILASDRNDFSAAFASLREPFFGSGGRLAAFA
jgi:hypothetical protein